MPKPVQNDLAKFNDLMDENRRLRGEVRRLRRVIRTPSVLGEFATCRYCGAGVRMPCDSRRIKHFPWCIAGAALAPRRRKKP